MNNQKLVGKCTAVLFFITIMSSFPVNAGILDDIKSLVNDTRNRVYEVLTNVRDTRNTMRDTRKAFTQNVTDSIGDAVSDVTDEFQRRQALRTTFLGGGDCVIGDLTPCGEFRGQIIELVEDLGALTNTLFVVTELEQLEIKSEKLVDVLEVVPGRALYPLYRAFSEELNIFDSEFVGRIQTMASTVNFLKESVPGSACEVITEFPTVSENAIKATKISAMGLKLVGKIFEAIGTKQIQKEVAAWGWAGVSVTNNRLKNVGIKFHAAGEALSGYGRIASTKLLRCTILKDHQEILASLGTFDPDVSNLDVAVSSRATQDSVDGIQASLVSLDTDVSTLASQDSLNTRASQDSVNVLGVNLTALASDLASRSSQASIDALAATLGGFDVSDLDVAVSTRASQASVDVLTASLGTLDTGNLDTAVSTRASQGSVDTKASQASVDALSASVGTLDTVDLDVPVSTRASQVSVDTKASQVSVDALMASVGSLDLGNLDAAVSTRASQVSVEALGSDIGVNNSMALRIQIEQQLSNNNKAVSAYYLPEAYGGLLELVRDTVSDTLIQNEAAGIPLQNAEQDFQQGEVALGESDYKKAYDNYQKAYQKVVK